MGISTSNIINNIRACAPFRSGRVKMTKASDFIPDYDKEEKIVKNLRRRKGQKQGRKSDIKNKEEQAKESYSKFESQLIALGQAMKEGKARLG